MTADELALASATRQAQAIRDGEITSRGLLETLITRIERINPTLNAIVTLDLERARAAADAADAAQARGDEMGPLHGLPVTIKDALQTAGIRSTGGATELKDNVPEIDAPVVAAVKRAGAIVFGKTNLPRWSSDLQSFNDLFGTTVNPWDPERVPGGSSGGAAAAVAAGLTSFEIGTDIGGSIRFPSSFCGVFGHKPSWGLVPSTGYIDHINGGTTEADLNVIGPIARSAEDLELLLNILKRRDGPLIGHLAPVPTDVTHLRVAAWLDDPYCPIDEEVLGRMDAAVTALEASGVSVNRQARPDIDPAGATGTGLLLLGAAVLQSLAYDAESGSKEPAELPDVSHRSWLDADAARQAIRAKWAQFFDDYDAILMPVTIVPPFRHDHEGNLGTRTVICNGESRPHSDLVNWPTLTGMAYLPVSVPPLGRGPTGLPIGIQVVGSYGGDLTTIRLAGHIADLCGGYQPPPIA